MPYRPLTSPPAGTFQARPLNEQLAYLKDLLASLVSGGEYRPLTPGPEITPYSGGERIIPSTLGPGYRQPIPSQGATPGLADFLKTFGPGGGRGPLSAVEPGIGEPGAAPIASPFPPGMGMELPPLRPPSYIPPMVPSLNEGGGGFFNNPPVPQMAGDPLQYTPEVSPFPPGRGMELPPLRPPTTFGTPGGPPLVSDPAESRKVAGQGMDWLAQLLFDPAMGPESWGQYLRGDGSPATAAGAPAPGAGPHGTTPVLGSPEVPPVPGGPETPPGQPAPGTPGGPISIPADLEPPAPIHYMTPPAQTPPAMADYSKMEEYLKQAGPKGLPPELLNQLMMTSVLGGLASGAATVDTSKPATLSRVLAAAGGAGLEGAASGTKARIADAEQMRQLSDAYAVRMANFEGDKAKAVADHANAVSDTNYNNKIAEYKTGIANDEAQRGYTKELKDLYKPQVTATAKGIVVQSYDPQTKSVKIDTYNTNNIWDEAGKVDDITKSFGPNSVVTQNTKANFILDSISKLPLPMREPALRHETMRQIVESGMGKQAFGDAYDKAEIQAKDEMGVEYAQNPDKVAPLINARIADLLFNTQGLDLVSSEWSKVAADAGIPLAKAYVKSH